MSEVKITSMQIENVKRVKAIHLEPSPTGLTVIGGRNGQGKTSVLDAIAWALGGAKMQPTSAQREGADTPLVIKLTLSNGLIVERKGKSSALTVTDPKGMKAGQALLDAFVSQFALDMPKFLNANDKEKAQILLKTLGIGEELSALDEKVKSLYNRRTEIGRIAESKGKHAEELPAFRDAPTEKVNTVKLVEELQAANAQNAGRAKVIAGRQEVVREAMRLSEELKRVTEEYAAAKEKLQKLDDILACGPREIDTSAIQSQINGAEEVNAKVDANVKKAAALKEANEHRAQYDALSTEIEDTRKARGGLLDNANLPLAGLTVENGDLMYNGKRWDCMSGSEQLRVAVAIVRRLNPECGFVLMDKLEQMDTETLSEFGEWLNTEGLQVIATRVSTGGECSIVIEDGTAATLAEAEGK